MIPFNRAFTSGKESQYIDEVLNSNSFSGGGRYTQQCEDWLKDYTASTKVLLTSSCTHALEMCALLIDIKPGDEVIMASFNFVSAANAFVLRGATIKFVDVDPGSMNLDANKLETAINAQTKAILVMHYGGVACDMIKIMRIAETTGIWVIEDAAHCIGAYAAGRHLGTIGHLGALSFHSTKNIHCGEGGALLINDPRFSDAAEIIREKGTNRNAFLRGEVEKYTWEKLGSSYLMSEITAAFLLAQLEEVKKVNEKRRYLWIQYYQLLTPLANQIELPSRAPEHEGNAHLFFIKLKTQQIRDELIANLSADFGIQCYFHYQPLHSTGIGQQSGAFVGEDRYTSGGSRRLLRLPLYYDMETSQVEQVVDAIQKRLENL
ncbi:MAG: dTDP-4-amino-4,6-dideoxygalactose transaminase [Cyanothece sp. SIO1E1]|nr:dTDP-4-amino-4,6-dideoxygalactose transaminase [Cyanothece sp. SIO1E1]